MLYLRRIASRIATGGSAFKIQGAIMYDSPNIKRMQEEGEKLLRGLIGFEDAEKMIENRIKRDLDKAHITLAGPGDGKLMLNRYAEDNGISKGAAKDALASALLNDPEVAGSLDDIEVKGLGKAEKEGKTAYFVVLGWPAGEKLRAKYLAGVPGAAGQDFHITVGFGEGGDVHGVRKDESTLVV